MHSACARDNEQTHLKRTVVVFNPAPLFVDLCVVCREPIFP
jgi:hypothetical protein